MRSTSTSAARGWRGQRGQRGAASRLPARRRHVRIKLANEVGVISAITSLTTIIGGNLTRRVAMVGLPHSAARKLVAKIPS